MSSATEYTLEVVDMLRREGHYSEPTYEDYDVELYDRWYRTEMVHGEYPLWTATFPEPEMGLQPRPDCALDKPYMNRIGAFTRRDFLHADEIGVALAQNNIWYTDGPGTHLLESLMICKKYGLTMYWYAPDCPPYLEGYAGVPLPFTNAEIQAYIDPYRKEVELFADWLDHVGRAYNQEFRDWVLYTGIDALPLDLFHFAMIRNPMEVRKEFEEEFGFPLPFQAELRTPQEKARRIKFWRWIKGKFAKVTQVRADVFRSVLPGQLMANYHFSATLDYVATGDIYDMVGPNFRMMLLDNDMGRLYEVGYGVRLTSDLCGKPVMPAIRANLLAVGCRAIPSPEAIHYWYSQAIQNGAHGFYIFFQDFPHEREAYTSFDELRKVILGINPPKGDLYAGPGAANPTPSARSALRWQAFLEASKKVGQVRVFSPPVGETGILVSLDSCCLNGWKRVFSSYVELAKAGVWSNFVSDEQIERDRASLSRFKVLHIPTMPFVQPKVLQAIVAYVHEGGTIITSDPNIFSFDLDARDMSLWRREIFGLRAVRQISGTVAGARVRAGSDEVWVRAYEQPVSPVSCGGTEVIGWYEDSSPAMLSNRYGSGRAIFSGVPLHDVYDHVGRGSKSEDQGRYGFFKALEAECGIRDQSWIWDVRLENIEEVVGSLPERELKIDKSIQFRDFMIQNNT